MRFGNVLGSNGSVLRAFEAQAEQGLPITVTHPDITRYFMTIAEASRLVIYAGAIGDPGEVLILDMGEPVRILDVAERFAAQHDPPLEIVFTGLRPSEKLHEDLIVAGRARRAPGAQVDHTCDGRRVWLRSTRCRAVRGVPDPAPMRAISLSGLPSADRAPDRPPGWSIAVAGPEARVAVHESRNPARQPPRTLSRGACRPWAGGGRRARVRDGGCRLGVRRRRWCGGGAPATRPAAVRRRRAARWRWWWWC